MKCLLVERESEVADVMGHLVQGGGFELTRCADADSAKRALEREPFELLVLDLGLAGLSGLDFCQQVRRLGNPPAHILAIVGRESDDGLQAVLAAGADDYLTRPIEAKRLEIRLAVATRQIQVVAERKRADDSLRGQERALLESEEKWRSLVENAPDIIMVIDREGIIRFINRTIPSLTVAGVVGTSCFDYMLPEAIPRFRAAMARAFDRGESDEFEVKGHAGMNELGWFSCRIGPLKVDGAIDAAVMVVTEITKSKRSEAALLKEQSLLKRLIDLQERERQFVAYEIHDGLAQYLTGSLMHLEACNAAAAGDAAFNRHDFERGVSLLRTAVSEARRLISGLRPPILDEAGIVAAVEYLVNESRYVLPELTYQHETTFERLTPQLECAVFRIVQEALTNVRRHSQSTRAAVELVEKEGILRIEIRDWGVGFDPHQVREERFGLQGIRERARLLGGFAKIDSAPGQGTRVTVEFPLAGELSD